MVTSKKKTSEGPEFSRSPELKRAFQEASEHWCRRNRLGLADLAERCGVSLQYLSHVGRYGRIPSKPILTLLALNLSPDEPAVFFRAARMTDAWPYDSGIGLRPRSAAESGLLSVSLDMKGFADAIRDIVRAEIQPKRIEQLLGKRALRVGVNRGQFFLLDERKGSNSEAFFPELIRALVLSLHCEVEFVNVPHSQFQQELERGGIDCYGPIYRTVPRIGHALFSKPFCHVSVAGLSRVRKASNLTELPVPKKVTELRKRDYIVAVHRDTMAHHFAEAELGIPRERLLPCDGPEEAVERVVLASLPRPAHIMLTDAPFAEKTNNEHPTTTELLVFNADSDAPPFEDTLAVRADWPALLAVLDEALDYLRKNGSLVRLFERAVGQPQSLGIMPAA